MTSFRRFVIAVAEVMQVLSMIICTLLGGMLGAASGAMRSAMFGMIIGDVHIDGIGQTVSGGAVLGFILGAIGGFIASSTLAGIVFTFVQIERNTRGPLENVSNFSSQSEQYNAAPRF